MFDLIKKAIVPKKEAEPNVIKDERKVELMASVLLLEAAHADFECSEQEQEHVVETVRHMFNLPNEYIDELLELAYCERKSSADLYQFTRQVNKQMSRNEKLAIIEAVWRIIYADGQVDKYEEHFARRLTDLLWLEHKDFINAKLRARER